MRRSERLVGCVAVAALFAFALIAVVIGAGIACGPVEKICLWVVGSR